MDIKLDRLTKIPLYRQLMNQIIEQISAGILHENQRLPSERKLASRLDINRSTVVRAYDELYAEGFVERKSSSGTYVLGQTKDSFSHHLYLRPGIHLNQEDKFSLFKQEAEKMIHQNSSYLIDLYTGELPSNLIPNISLPNLNWQNFLQEKVSDLGYKPLRHEIQKLMSRMYDYNPAVEDLMLTAGGQQSLFLLIQVLLKPGDTVVIEEPSFFNALKLFRLMSIEVIKIPVDPYGLCVDELEKVLQLKSVQLVLTNPNFQNPTGTTLSFNRRKKLIELCQTYQIPIIEDDVFGQLSYEVPNKEPLLKKLAPESVIYIGSLSKILGQRMQLGWIDAPKLVWQEVLSLRDEYESELSIFPQVLASYALNEPMFVKESERLNHHSFHILNLLQKEFIVHFKDKLVYQLPSGGYYLWLTYKGKNLTEKDWLLLIEEELIVFPSFLITMSFQSFRLNVSRLEEEQIPELVRRLLFVFEKWEEKEG